MKIFSDCISTMRGARRGTNASNIVIPTLIAQIDGIQGEFMRKKGVPYHLTHVPRGTAPSKPKAWFQSQTFNQKVLDAGNDVFLNILFQSARAGQPLEKPFSFNRHKIMHGEDMHYGRRDNTIRAFLILDFLAWLK